MSGTGPGELGEENPGKKSSEYKGPEARMSWKIRRGKKMWLSWVEGNEMKSEEKQVRNLDLILGAIGGVRKDLK